MKENLFRMPAKEGALMRIKAISSTPDGMTVFHVTVKHGQVEVYGASPDKYTLTSRRRPV